MASCTSRKRLSHLDYHVRLCTMITDETFLATLERTHSVKNLKQAHSLPYLNSFPNLDYEDTCRRGKGAMVD